MKPVLGRRIVCGGKVHYEQAEVAPFNFADYSWECKACGGRHCSECFYETDGETITVRDCGRFGMSDKATELWAALVAKADNEPDLAKRHIANDDRAFLARDMLPDVLAALEELPCYWAVPCGERERMREEPPDPCIRCKALADARKRLLEALDA